MNTYILVHTHKYGDTVIPFQSKSKLQTLEKSIDKVIKIMDIDFEEDEDISILEFNPNDLVTVKI